VSNPSLAFEVHQALQGRSALRECSAWEQPSEGVSCAKYPLEVLHTRVGVGIGAPLEGVDVGHAGEELRSKA